MVPGGSSGSRSTGRLRAVKCPLCGGASAVRFEAHGYPVLRCQACGHEFAGLSQTEGHVERTYSGSYFHGGAAGYADYLAEAGILRDHGRRYARLIRPWRGPGRMLDVGAAAGFILRGFADEGWTGIGVEPNAVMARHGREQLGIDVRQGTLESCGELGQFDLVSMIQVIAHFADPVAALGAAARLTRPGGYWLIETWNRASWTARMFGKNWHEYSPPSVLHWFTPGSLEQAAARFGMRRVAGGRPGKWIAGGHAVSLLKHKSRVLGSVAERLVPERLAIPYPAEDLFWMLLRQG